MTRFTFTLSKKAKSGGADKYDCSTIEGFNIYFPQTISRVNNVPVENIKITIDNEVDDKVVDKVDE